MRSKAIGLIRVSTEEQAAEDRAGLLRQREDLRAAATRWNLDIIDTVEITDVSGTNIQNSPLFQDLVKRLEAPSITGIVVSHLDRLIRQDKLSDFRVFSPFEERNKLIFTPTDRLDLKQDSSVLQVVFGSLMAGFDRKKILHMTQSAKEANRKRGRLANAKITLPQGIDFDFKTGKWSWVEPYAGRIVRAFNLFLSGNHSIKQIAKMLEYKTDRTLYNHLRNPIWTGRRVYTHKRGDEKYPSKDGKQADRKKVLRAEPLDVPIDLEPLIPKETFDRAQKLLAAQTKQWKSHRSAVSRFEVVGLLHCACGEKMDSQARAKGKPGREYYRCRSRSAGKGCGRKYTERTSIEHTVIEFVKAYCMQPDVLKALLTKRVPVHRTDQTKRVEAETALKRLEQERQRLLTLAVKGLMNDSDVERENKRITSERAGWLLVLQSNTPKESINIATAAQAVATAFAEFSFLTLTDRKRLLRKMFSRITVDHDHIVAATLHLPRTNSRNHTLAVLPTISAKSAFARHLRSSDTCRKSRDR